MFNIFKGTKTIVEQNKKIKNQKELISEQNTEWVEQHTKIKELERAMKELEEQCMVVYEEKAELQKELDETIENKDIAEKRNVEYARMIKAVMEELNKNQYGSVENLQNKIKSMLTVPEKHF